MTNSISYVIRAGAHNRAERPDYSIGWAYQLMESSVSYDVTNTVRTGIWTRVSLQVSVARRELLSSFPFGGTA